MKRFVRWLVYALVAIAVIFVAGAYILPGEAVVRRQIAISAPPERIFPLLNDLKRMNAWSPWAELDPATTYEFAGPSAGVGQKMSWSSANPTVGSGSMAIVESIDNRRVATALDFGEMGSATAAIDLNPTGAGTMVTWVFQSELRNPLERWMGPLIARSVAADYDKGLARLKAAVEASQ